MTSAKRLPYKLLIGFPQLRALAQRNIVCSETARERKKTLSTQPAGSKASPRFPSADGHEGRSARARPAACQGPQKAVGVDPAQQRARPAQLALLAHA